MRRLLYTGIGLGVLLLGAAAVLWSLRIPLATWYATQRLDAAGLSEMQFEITALEWGRAQVGAVRIGGPQGPSVDRITARFDPLALWRGDYGGIEYHIVGPRATLETTEDGLRIAGWPEGLDARADQRMPAGSVLAALSELPDLQVRRARLALDAAVGRWQVRGRLDTKAGAGSQRAAHLEAEIANTRLRVDGTLNVDYDGRALRARARVGENDGFRVRLQGELAGPRDQPRLTLDYGVLMPAAADLPWALLPGRAPKAGRLRLEGEAAGRLRALRPPGDVAGWVNALARGDWQGAWQVHSRDLALADGFSGLTLDAAGAWQARRGGLTVTTAGEGALQLERIAPGLWRRLAPAAARPYLAGPLRVRWPQGDWLQIEPAPNGRGATVELLPRLRLDWPQQAGTGNIQARLRARLTGLSDLAALDVPEASLDFSNLRLGEVRVGRVALVGGVEGLLGEPAGEIDLSVDLPAVERRGVRARDVSLRLPLRLESGEGGRRLRVRAPGRLRGARVGLPGAYRLAGPAAVAIPDGRLQLAAAQRYRLKLEPESLRLEPTDAQAALPAVAVEAGELALTGHLNAGDLERLALRAGAARLPGQGVAMEGVAATWRPSARSDWLRFEIARLQRAQAEPRVPPVQLQGRVSREPSAYGLAGQGTLGAGAAPFEFAGEVEPGGTSGQVNVTLPPLEFRPESLQPRALLSSLNGLAQVRGRIGGQLEVVWDDGGLRGRARARIRDFGFARGPLEVAGLSGNLELARLRPPRTRQRQRLEASRFRAGLTIDEPRMAFAVARLPSGGTGLHVAEAQGRLLDGTVAVRDWAFDPAARVHKFAVRVDGISLAQTLERLRIPSLEGRGTLSGRVPVSVTPRGIAVRDGRLRGRDGHIRYRPARAERLAGGSRMLSLTLRALRDFRYDRIEIGVDRHLGGNSRVDIHLLGHNPDVLDGHPFDFNIALTGEVAPLLEAVVRGRALTHALIERHLQRRGPR